MMVVNAFHTSTLP